MLTQRKAAGAALLKAIRHREFEAKNGDWRLAKIGAFDIFVTARFSKNIQHSTIELTIQRTGRAAEIDYSYDLTALGIISRLEYCLGRFEVELAEQKRFVAEAADRLPGYRQRLSDEFPYVAELAAKRRELEEIDAALAANDSRDLLLRRSSKKRRPDAASVPFPSTNAQTTEPPKYDN